MRRPLVTLSFVLADAAVLLGLVVVGVFWGVAGFGRLARKDNDLIRMRREADCKYHSWQVVNKVMSCSLCGKVPGRDDDAEDSGDCTAFLP